VGRYRIERVPPGKCRVAAAGAETVVDFILTPGGLADADGHPLAEARNVFQLAPGSDRLRITHPEHATVERVVLVPKENARVELVLP
jgi:hypothetical protein